MVLEDRGWALHRVWCADWLRDPEAQLSRILRAIERARRGERAAVGSAALKAKPIERAQDAEDGEEAASASAPYIEADFEVALEGSLLEAPPEKLAEIVARIVEIEGPIHEDEVARRAAALGGAGRTSAKLSEAVVAALRAGVAGGKLAASAPFYRAASMDGVAPRDRSEVKSTSLRRVEMLPPEEIAAALERIVADHVGVSRDDAVVQAARLLGYRMTSAPLRATIEMQLDLLIAAEKVSEKDGALGARPDQGLMN
jgi:hypothetical protein